MLCWWREYLIIVNSYVHKILSFSFLKNLFFFPNYLLFFILNYLLFIIPNYLLFIILNYLLFIILNYLLFIIPNYFLFIIPNYLLFIILNYLLFIIANYLLFIILNFYCIRLICFFLNFSFLLYLNKVVFVYLNFSGTKTEKSAVHFCYSSATDSCISREIKCLARGSSLQPPLRITICKHRETELLILTPPLDMVENSESLYSCSRCSRKKPYFLHR